MFQDSAAVSRGCTGLSEPTCGNAGDAVELHGGFTKKRGCFIRSWKVAANKDRILYDRLEFYTIKRNRRKCLTTLAAINPFVSNITKVILLTGVRLRIFLKNSFTS